MDASLFELHASIEERHWWFVARRRIMRALLERVVPPGEDRLVVDVGCGTGANIAALAGGYRCVGIDTAAPAIELAARRYPRVRFVRGRAPDALADDAAAADAFLMMDVLEHVEDDFALFSAVAAAAHAGAHLLVTVPAVPRLWSAHDERFGHWRRYTSDRLARLWDGLPLEPLLLTHFNARLYPLVATIRALGRATGLTVGREGSDLGAPPPLANRALEACFAGERRRLLRALDRRAAPYTRGVSLLALLRRAPGELARRGRPPDVAADTHRPSPGGRLDPRSA